MVENKTNYDYNHTVRAEITGQHSKDVSSRPQWNGIREIRYAFYTASVLIKNANDKKQKLLVWIDDELWHNSHPLK